MKDLLPIGSVVTLKEGTKKLMIMGRLQQNVKTKKLGLTSNLVTLL